MVQLIVILIVLGIIAWAFWKYIPIPNPFKGVVMFLLILIACLFILHAFGISTKV